MRYLVLLNHWNNITRNEQMSVGCSKIRISINQSINGEFIHVKRSKHSLYRVSSPPLFKAPNTWSSLLPLFKTFVSPSLFSVTPPFNVIQTVSPTFTQPPLPLLLIQQTNLPYRCLKNIKRANLLVQLPLSIKKSIFDFSNPFRNMSVIYGIFPDSF